MELLIEQLPWALEEHWWTRLNFCSSQATLEWVPVPKEELFNTVKRVLLIVSGYRLNIDLIIWHSQRATKPFSFSKS